MGLPQFEFFIRSTFHISMPRNLYNRSQKEAGEIHANISATCLWKLLLLIGRREGERCLGHWKRVGWRWVSRMR